LQVGEFADGPYRFFSNLSAIAVRFGDGVGFVGLSLVLGGAVAQMHGNPDAFL